MFHYQPICIALIMVAWQMVATRPSSTVPPRSQPHSGRQRSPMAAVMTNITTDHNQRSHGTVELNSV